VLLVYTQPQNSLVPLLQEKYGLVDTEDTQSQAEVIKQGLAGTKVEEVQETVMNQPNYLGEDENKKLWSLKAQRAVQVGDLNSGTTQLTSVIANTLSLKDSKVDYFADEGDFISAEEKIVLRGNVKIKSDKLELSTQTLDYNLKTGYAESKTQVDILADFGNIIGDSMQSYDNAEKIVLIGNVRAKLYNK
jgi:LPS export ABC transporter protein LptC